MKILVISAVIVLAVVGGLFAGGIFSGSFLSAFSPTKQAVADDAPSGDDSPGFRIKMGSKSGSTADTSATEGGAEGAAEEPGTTPEDNATISAATTGQVVSQSGSSRSSGGGGGGNNEPPAEIACSSDSECKAGSYYNFCSGKDVMVAYGAEYCAHPGTESSECVYDDGKASAVLNRTCTYACGSGACITGVYISPSVVNVTSGSNFTVDVVISTDESMYAGDFRISYDAAALVMEGITLGSFFEPPLSAPVDKSEAGAVWYVLAKQSKTTGNTGTGTVFTVTFRAIAPAGGSVQLGMVGADLIDADTKYANSTLSGGVVNVQ
jgi:hypothetical protein